MPMVAHLNQHGFDTELWFENQPAHQDTVRQILVPHRHLDFDLTPRPVTFLARLARYRRQLRAAKPSVLHAHQTRASLIPLLAASLERVPIRIYHNHGLPYLGYRGPMRWALRNLETINIRLATHVLLVSHSNLEAARADGLLRRGTGEVLAHGSAVGIDLVEFAPERFDLEAKNAARQKFGAGDAAFVLGYVGRPVKRKGFHLLLSAWEKSGIGRQGNIVLIAGCAREECRRLLGRVFEAVIGFGYLT